MSVTSLTFSEENSQRKRINIYYFVSEPSLAALSSTPAHTATTTLGHNKVVFIFLFAHVHGLKEASPPFHVCELNLCLASENRLSVTSGYV